MDAFFSGIQCVYFSGLLFLSRIQLAVPAAVIVVAFVNIFHALFRPYYSYLLFSLSFPI